MSSILNRYKKLSKPAKASIWFIACYVIQHGLQFVGMPIYTRIMATEEYGVYSVFLSWFNIVRVFSSMSIYHGTFNKAMVKYEEERDRYISSIQYLTLLIGFIFSGLIIVSNELIYEYTGYSLKFQLLFCIHILFFPSLQYWSQKQRFLFEYKSLVFVTLLNSVASLGLGILFVLISSEKSFALVMVTVLVQAVINGNLLISLARKGRCICNREYWKWSVVTAIPLIPHYLSEIFLGHADRLMINQMVGAAQAGIYNIVYQISMVMTIIHSGINGAFTPWLYYALKDGKFSEIKNTTRMLAFMMAFMTFGLILIGPEILRIAAPISYYEAVLDIPAIMIACYFIFVYVLFLNVEIYYEQNQYVSKASVIAAVLNIILNYFCIRKWGYLAAGYTTMISYMVMAILHYIFLMKIARKQQEIYSIFDFKFIFLVCTALVVLGLLCIGLYDSMIARYGIVLAICIVAIIKKKEILRMMKEFRSKKEKNIE